MKSCFLFRAYREGDTVMVNGKSCICHNGNIDCNSPNPVVGWCTIRMHDPLKMCQLEFMYFQINIIILKRPSKLQKSLCFSFFIYYTCTCMLFMQPLYNGRGALSVCFVHPPVLPSFCPTKFVFLSPPTSLHRIEWNYVQTFYHKSRFVCREIIHVWQILQELWPLRLIFLHILDRLLNSSYIVA